MNQHDIIAELVLQASRDVGAVSFGQRSGRAALRMLSVRTRTQNIQGHATPATGQRTRW